MLKALFVLEIFKLLFWYYGYVEKRLDKKAKVVRVVNIILGFMD